LMSARLHQSGVMPHNAFRVPTWPTTDSAYPAILSGITHSAHPPDMVEGHVPRSERSERRRHPVVIGCAAPARSRSGCAIYSSSTNSSTVRPA
jgi:hypothetical protein